MIAKTTYLSNLTPLRGIAALITVMFHVDLFFGGGGNLLVKFADSLIMTKLYLMVDFFFILSGFIMLHVYGKWFCESTKGTDFKRFTIARFARVYPLHFITLIYCVGLYALFHIGAEDHDPMSLVSNNYSAIPVNLLLLHSMNTTEWFTWNNASWSISTEWWMYMIFPFMVKPFLKLQSIGISSVALGCFLGYLFITFHIIPIVTVPDTIPFVAVKFSDYGINVSYQYGFLRCFFGFVLGMVTYRIYIQQWFSKFIANGYVLSFLAVGLVVCLHFAIPDIFMAAFFPLILLSAAYGSPQINALLGTNVMQRLGDWSFSIYLTHQPILYTIVTIITYLNSKNTSGAPAGPPPSFDQLTGWIICFAVIAVVLLVSFLTYRFVEVPSRNYINKKWGKG